METGCDASVVDVVALKILRIGGGVAAEGANAGDSATSGSACNAVPIVPEFFGAVRHRLRAQLYTHLDTVGVVDVGATIALDTAAIDIESADLGLVLVRHAGLPQE